MESISLLINIDSFYFIILSLTFSPFSIFIKKKKTEIIVRMCEKKKHSSDALYTCSVSGRGEAVRK